jgi:hypothetical protein
VVLTGPKGDSHLAALPDGNFFMTKFENYLDECLKCKEPRGSPDRGADFLALRNLIVLLVDIEHRRVSKQTLDRRGGRGYDLGN